MADASPEPEEQQQSQGDDRPVPTLAELHKRADELNEQVRRHLGERR